MRIALAQLDSRLGDVPHNTARAREATIDAHARGADLVVFPELHLTGCGPGGSGPGAAITAEEAATACAGLAGVVGFRERAGSALYNSALYVDAEGAPVHVHRKLYLVDYPPWSEDEHVAPGESLRTFETPHGRAAMLICNDAWQPHLPTFVAQRGAEILIVPSASSTAMPEVESYWRDLTRFYARMLECYVVFVNRVGSEGTFSFWGGSHVVDPLGRVVAEAPLHEEEVLVVEIEPEGVAARRRELPLLGEARPALLRDELERAGA
jgi:predicted amidohydrolase